MVYNQGRIEGGEKCGLFLNLAQEKLSVCSLFVHFFINYIKALSTSKVLPNVYHTYVYC